LAWHRHIIDSLRACQKVEVKHHGHAMLGRIEDGDIATVAPIGKHAVDIGDMVLVFCEGNYLIRMIGDVHGLRFRIDDMRGKTLGWVNYEAVQRKVATISKPQ